MSASQHGPMLNFVDWAQSSRRLYARYLQALLRRLLEWRHPRQDDLDSGAAARFRFKVEPTAETVGDDAVDDMQSEPGAALVATSGKERVERAAANIERHAAAIVGKDDLDIVPSGFAHLNVDHAWPAIRKGMRHRVEEQVGQHLAVGTRIAVHDQVRLTIDVERQVALAQAWPQSHHNLLGQIGQIERPLIRVVAVGGNLLE